MATQAYRQWVAAGKPWELATPIAEIEKWCKANGFTVLGTIGDNTHLTSSNPQDHTPFSFTAHPVPLPGYFVCAIDIADERGLGAAILSGARAGRFPFLKYCNVGGFHYDYRDGFKAGKPNPDRHNHLSILSTWIFRSIGTFDPFGHKKKEEVEGMVFIKVKGAGTAETARIYVSGDNKSYRHVKSNSAYQAARAAGVRLIEVGSMEELEDLVGKPEGTTAPELPTAEAIAAAIIAQFSPKQ